MKKKSLLILPVLLLALAACNKEEEVEEPEDNTPGITDTTDGNQGNGDGGDGGEKEPVVDTRIIITEGEVDDEKWTNDSSLSFASVTTDESGNVTYVLDGDLSKMTEPQATAFGAGAQVGDEYVLLTVTLFEGETVTWGFEIEETNKTRSYDQYPNGMDVVLKVTSEGASSVKFTIANSTAETSVDHIVDLSAYVTTSEGVE